VRVLRALLTVAVLTFMSFYALQNGDPLYRSQTEKAAYEANRSAQASELIERARKVALHRMGQPEDRKDDALGIAPYDANHEKVRSVIKEWGADWVYGDSYEAQLRDRDGADVQRLQRAALEHANAANKANSDAEEMRAKTRAAMATIRTLTYVTGAGIVGAAGGAALGAGKLAGALGASGISYGYDAYKSKMDASRDSDRINSERKAAETRTNDVQEGYAQARESRDLMRRYNEALNSSKLDTIAKSARTSFSVPSLPKLSLNLKFAFGQARRRVSGKSEGPV